MAIATELRRKLFHHLSLVYMAIYVVCPRWVTLLIFSVSLCAAGAVEFLRLRRPELNDRLLHAFKGIHRTKEITQVSGIFWTLLGCWMTIVIFPDRRIVLPAFGFLAFGDSAAALVGLKWGRHPVPPAMLGRFASMRADPTKTLEGSAAFAAVSCLWALLFVRWPVALLSAIAAAWMESRQMPWNDNFWIPVLGALELSILSLMLGHR